MSIESGVSPSSQPGSASNIASEVSKLYASRWLQGYVRSKIKSDPVYLATCDQLRDCPDGILDLGCGVGVLAFYLRSMGLERPMLCIDSDARKITAARAAAARIPGITDLRFEHGDARAAHGFAGNVTLLDVLHYASDDDQRSILRNAALSTSPGSRLVIRECLRDSSWRFAITYAQERMSRTIGWLRGDRLNFPRKEFIVETLAASGLECERVLPLWQNTPFNNYLLVFTRRRD